MSDRNNRGLDATLLDLRVEVVRRTLERSGVELGWKGEQLLREGVDLAAMRPELIHPLLLRPRGFRQSVRWTAAWMACGVAELVGSAAFRRTFRVLLTAVAVLLIIAFAPLLL